VRWGKFYLSRRRLQESVKQCATQCETFMPLQYCPESPRHYDRRDRLIVLLNNEPGECNMPRKPDMGDGKKISKAYAYRDAAKALGKDADLDAVQKHIRDNFGIDMEKTQISQYRSNEKKRKGKRGRKPKTAAVTQTVTKPSRGDSLLQFVSAVRGWENEIGAEKICDVIDALYKNK
jgi:hypothetical protein